jgi:hypothetical protein
LALLSLETVYLGMALPETKGVGVNGGGKAAGGTTKGKPEEKSEREAVEVRRKRLNALGRLHGVFLLFFSGVSPLCVVLGGRK